jgi:hypothetical protein
MGNQALVVSRATFKNLLDDDPEVRRQAMVVLAQQPVQALALLQNPAACGLTMRGAADVLDHVASVIPVDEAAETLQKNLSSDRLAELLTERGDLGSTAALVADRKTVLLAMVKDLAEQPPENIAVILFSWAQKLKDRADWSKMLNMRLGQRDLRWYLLMYIWNMSGRPELPDQLREMGIENEEADDRETLDDMDLDKFDEIGLDVDDSMVRLQALIRDGETKRWEQSVLAESARQMMRRIQAQAKKPKLTGFAQEVAEALKSQETAADGFADEFELGLK